MAKSPHRSDPEDVILEPGDPGYEEPEVSAEGVPAQSPSAPDAPGIPAGKDVRIPREPDETDAEYHARTAHLVPVSESPSDTVPNRPNIYMAPPPPVEEPAPEEETHESGS